MRIISGMAGGIRLAVPGGNEIRPTEDRVKETMFSILGNLEGLCVLDLFSGTGALGLEALSRGASKVVMVEKQPRHAKVIEKNIAAVKKSIGARPCGETELMTCDVKAAATVMKRNGIQADIILADPPYETREGEFGAAELLLCKDYVDLAAQDCILVLEYRTGTILPWHPESPWHPFRSKTAGIRTFTMASLIPYE